jgi:hypothetical protein
VTCVLRVSAPAVAGALRDLSIQPVGLEDDTARFSVSAAGPDRLADQIEDAIVFLRRNKDELEKLMALPSASAWLEFGVEKPSRSTEFGRLSPELVCLAGKLGIGLELSLSPGAAAGGTDGAHLVKTRGMLVALAVSLLTVACVSSTSREASSCAGAAVEVGTIRRPMRSFQVVRGDGSGVPDARWRYRKQFLFPGRWSEWSQVESSMCACNPACGSGGVSDLEDGRYEIEICSPGCRPLHGHMDVRALNRGEYVVLTAQAAERAR